MKGQRLSLRIPPVLHIKLTAVAASSGYASPQQLVRCVLSAFLDRCGSQAASADGWLEELEEQAAEAFSPKQRKNINERL